MSGRLRGGRACVWIGNAITNVIARGVVVHLRGRWAPRRLKVCLSSVWETVAIEILKHAIQDSLTQRIVPVLSSSSTRSHTHTHTHTHHGSFRQALLVPQQLPRLSGRQHLLIPLSPSPPSPSSPPGSIAFLLPAHRLFPRTLRRPEADHERPRSKPSRR